VRSAHSTSVPQPGSARGTATARRRLAIVTRASGLDAAHSASYGL
jgi:hypothetical protein